MWGLGGGGVPESFRPEFASCLLENLLWTVCSSSNASAAEVLRSKGVTLSSSSVHRATASRAPEGLRWSAANEVDDFGERPLGFVFFVVLEQGFKFLG